MQSRLNPYINFKDTTKAAMEFYQTVFGGKLDMNTFKEGGMPAGVDDNKIMHAQLDAENGMMFMASDTPPSMEYTPGAAISISLSGDNEAELRGYWDKLQVGGTIVMPLEKAPWGDIFGMLTDKFGIKWLVNISPVQV
jgi:PhnB protein